MKPKIVVVCKIAVWVILMLVYFKVALFSVDNRFAYIPDWIKASGTVACPDQLGFADRICVFDISYSAMGWPVAVPPGIVTGPVWLAWTINLAVMAVFGVLLAIGLRKLLPAKRKVKDVKSKT